VKIPWRDIAIAAAAGIVGKIAWDAATKVEVPLKAGLARAFDPGMPSDVADTVAQVLGESHDVGTLRTLAIKLRAAGFGKSATQLDAKADDVQTAMGTNA
jgi:hypothetical protein